MPTKSTLKSFSVSYHVFGAPSRKWTKIIQAVDIDAAMLKFKKKNPKCVCRIARVA